MRPSANLITIVNHKMAVASLAIPYSYFNPPAIVVRHPELSLDETRLLVDFRRINYYELEDPCLYLVSRLSDFNEEGDRIRIVDYPGGGEAGCNPEHPSNKGAGKTPPADATD